MYNKPELSEFEFRINKKLMESRETLAELREQLQSLNESRKNVDVWDAEEATDSDGLDLLLKLIHRTQEYITNLQHALIRIHNNTYGICKTTGQMIPKERLMAHPCATEIVAAKNLLDAAKPFVEKQTEAINSFQKYLP